jgi:hypothetical protein
MFKKRNSRMKRIRILSLLSAFILFAFACSSTPDSPDTQEPLQAPSTQKQKTEPSTSPLVKLTWPRFIEHEKGTLKIHQPQIEKWEKEIIEYRMAIEILMKDRSAPIYGALWLKGETDTNLDERLVKIKNVEVSDISIPSGDLENVEGLKKFINDTCKEKQLVISLDRILTDVASLPDVISVRKTNTKMGPPNIFAA